jgi:hypothetical protein
MALTAPTVSRRLKEAGFGVVQTRQREGIRVHNGATKGTVCVCVDLDRPGEAARLADTLADWLLTNPPGWTWTRDPEGQCIFTITEGAGPLAPATTQRPEAVALEQFARYFEETCESIGMEPNVGKAVPAIVRAWAAQHYGGKK